MGNVSLMVMSMAVAGKGSSFLGEGSNFMDIFINFLSMIWDAVGDTLMSVVYFIVKFMLNIVDFLQFFVGKLVGINVWMDGTDVTQLELQDLDIIFRFLYSSEVQRVFKALIIIGAVLLIIFTIIAVVQSEYKTAQGDDDAFKKGKAFVLKRALTAVTLMIFVPIMTIVGILASNAVLASLTKTLNANTTLTFGGQIFVASSYDASRYRYYAMTGSRIPVTYPNAIEVVNPSKTGSGSSYYLVDANGNLTYWTGSLKNMEGELADVAYNTWEYNKKYKDFVTNWDNSYTLNNVSWESAEGDGATYSAFIVDNATDYKDEYDFSYINKTGDYMNGSVNNVYTKTYSTGHAGYASYAPIPAEYMVVADFIDYAIEYSQKVDSIEIFMRYFIKQIGEKDCALTCLKMLLAIVYKSKKFLLYPLDDIERTYSLEEIIKIASKEGVKLYAFRFKNKEDLVKQTSFPVLVPIKSGNTLHMVLIRKIKKNKLLIYDPAEEPKWVDFYEFTKIWNGECLEINEVKGSLFKEKKFNLVSKPYKVLVPLFQLLSFGFLIFALFFIDENYSFLIPLCFLVAFVIFEFIYRTLLINEMKSFDNRILNNFVLKERKTIALLF